MIFRRFPFPFVIVLCVIVTESDLAKIYEQKSLRVIKIIICTLEKLVCIIWNCLFLLHTLSLNMDSVPSLSVHFVQGCCCSCAKTRHISYAHPVLKKNASVRLWNFFHCGAWKARFFCQISTCSKEIIVFCDYNVKNVKI